MDSNGVMTSVPATTLREQTTREHHTDEEIVRRIVSGRFLDVAVRDLVMALGAFTLARLSAMRATSTQPVPSLRTHAA